MDDEALIRQMGTAILRRQGYDVCTVSDGAEALHEFIKALQEGRPYALVILDLTIPGGMGGGQALEGLRKLDPEVKAIVSSGYSKDAVLSNYQAHGYQGMVSKPYSAEDLALAVDSVLSGGQA
jgi:CheY-like chemotaxis protein